MSFCPSILSIKDHEEPSVLWFCLCKLSKLEHLSSVVDLVLRVGQMFSNTSHAYSGCDFFIFIS